MYVLFYRGWKLQLSTLPALQNSGHRSLRSYVRRIVRCVIKTLYSMGKSFTLDMEVIRIHGSVVQSEKLEFYTIVCLSVYVSTP